MTDDVKNIPSNDSSHTSRDSKHTSENRSSTTVLSGRFLRESPPFDLDQPSSDELFYALGQIGRYTPSCRYKIYNITAEYFFEEIDPSDLSVENGVHLRQIEQYIKETEQYDEQELEAYIDKFFEDINDSNFKSLKTRSEYEEEISPIKAIEWIREYRERIQQGVDSAFDADNSSTNKMLMYQATKSYLWTIWPSIDNSEIENKPEVVEKQIHIDPTACRRCGRKQGLVGKYDILLCRQCFREIAREIGFKKYR